jgi:7-carboxy-7-deazaguanine synthase
VAALLERGNTVLVETNGSMDIRRLPAGSVAIVDMKCPSSGMSGHMDFENLRRLRPADELKFVIRDVQDYRWAKTLLQELGRPDAGRQLFSPAWPDLNPALLAEWIQADKLPVRLQIPLQRVLWPTIQRGR